MQPSSAFSEPYKEASEVDEEKTEGGNREERRNTEDKAVGPDDPLSFMKFETDEIIILRSEPVSANRHSHADFPLAIEDLILANFVVAARSKLSLPSAPSAFKRNAAAALSRNSSNKSKSSNMKPTQILPASLVFYSASSPQIKPVQLEELMSCQRKKNELNACNTPEITKDRDNSNEFVQTEKNKNIIINDEQSMSGGQSRLSVKRSTKQPSINVSTDADESAKDNNVLEDTSLDDSENKVTFLDQ